MKRRRLLAIALALTAAAPLAAREVPKSENSSAQRRDAEVLERVMLDLLTGPESPVEPRNAERKQIYLAMEASSGKWDVPSLLSRKDEKQWEKVSPAELKLVEESAEHLVSRLEKKEFCKPFAPKDKRIVPYAREQAEKDAKQPSIQRPQVFRPDPPGYSRDGRFAMVTLSFTWSGGFHGASGRYVLTYQNDRWIVLVRELVFIL